MPATRPRGAHAPAHAPDVRTLRFIGRRVAQSLPLLLLISLLIFALIHAAPGGPLSLYLDNPNVRPEDIERLRRSLGLDRSLPEQYLAWLVSFVRGDWGFSYADGRPVLTRILERFPATLELVGFSIVIALIAAVPVGIAAAINRNFERVASVTLIAGISLPVFWFGLMLQLVFANLLGWLPSSGRSSFGGGGVSDRVSHLILPATVLAAVHAAAWSRYLRSTMHETLARPFIRAARARGVSEYGVLVRHALPNALPPFVTIVLLDASIMVSGAVVTESVFAWPGVGSLFTEALAKRDYTVLMAFLMCGSVAVMVLNLLADLTVRALDPHQGASLMFVRMTRTTRTAAVFLAVLIGAAILAPLVVPYSFDALDLANRRAAPSIAHWFGTDELGRDVLTRVLFGARVSLAVGLLSAFVSVAVGVAIGATAGYAGRWIDDLLMRLTDAMLAVPRLPLLMIAAAILQPSVPLLVLLVGAAGWMETARVVRAEVQSIAARDFITSARAIGARPARIVWRHVLPGVVPVLSVAATLAVGRGILIESALSFFGVGVQPPTASWGNMLYQAQTTMTSEPWLALFPGLFIFLTVLACNAVGTRS